MKVSFDSNLQIPIESDGVEVSAEDVQFDYQTGAAKVDCRLVLILPTGSLPTGVEVRQSHNIDLTLTATEAEISDATGATIKAKVQAALLAKIQAVGDMELA